jgi:predicted amidophosphoribosyltransferase
MWSAILDFVIPAQCAGCNALGSGLCAACVPFGAARVRVSLPGIAVAGYGCYEGILRAAVLALKDGRRDVARSLGERIAPLLVSGSVLVPVPTTPKRRRVRGFDGVAALAARAGELAGAAVTEALEQRAGDAQRGRSRDQRLAAHGRFVCDSSLVEGAGVTLIDDVCTTGATLLDCARAVAAAGARVEGAVVVAVTKTSNA